MASKLRTGVTWDASKAHLVIDNGKKKALCGVEICYEANHETVKKAYEWANCKNCKRILIADSKNAMDIRKYVGFYDEI